jgi:HSP20 family protein
MSLVRWNPFTELERVQREMNRLFNDTTGGLAKNESASLSRWTPAVDIFEAEDEIRLTAELPGMRRDDVRVDVEDRLLTISGERRLENEDKQDDYTRIERVYGQFSRSFNLPSTVDVDKISAEMEDGVLRVHMPKREESKPRQIEVKVS